jgi:hypothetical protein
MPPERIRFEKLPTKWFLIALGGAVVLFGTVAIFTFTGLKDKVYPSLDTAAVQSAEKCGDHCSAPWEAFKIVLLLGASAIFMFSLYFVLYKGAEFIRSKEQDKPDKPDSPPSDNGAGK